MPRHMSVRPASPQAWRQALYGQPTKAQLVAKIERDMASAYAHGDTRWHYFLSTLLLSR